MTDTPTRDQIAEADKWNLNSLYRSDQDWEQDLEKLKTFGPKLSSYDGTLGTNKETLLAFLELYEEVGQLEERLGYYAMLRQSEDLGDSTRQDRYARFMNVAVLVDAATSFFAPEIQAIPQKTLDQWLKEPDFHTYRIMIDRILRNRPHTRTPDEEQILSLQQEPNQTASKTFSALVNADLDFGQVETPEGPRPLTQTTFGSLLEHPDRDVRQKTFHQFYEEFDHHKNTVAALLGGSVNLDVYQARVRRFDSALQMRLFPDNVPQSVYSNLIDTIHKGLPVLHRYYDVRRRALGIPKLAVYDTRVSLLPDIKVDIPYEQAVETIYQALAPLGTEYTTTLRDGLLSGWVDRYENKGKRAGAFSAGSFAANPYILMNYTPDTIRHVFTLAHEGGHSMHSWYSARNNPFPHYSYTIFEAEVASTFNEQLLMEHMLATETQPDMRAYLIQKHIDDIVATMFRQTMFAEYERAIHERVESGDALTVESLRKMYRSLLEQYFGPEVDLPEPADLEGMRIPHFYRAFYVYKYATGLAAAISLAQNVINGVSGSREAYFTFLKSGGSRFPIDSLKVGGVDMDSPEPVEQAIELFERRVSQLEEHVG